MRVQLALNVSDIEDAIDYYSDLFDVKPHKRRPGYANFVVAEPPLKLVLFENPAAKERLNHLGVEVLDQASLDVAVERLQERDLVDQLETEVTCCHATQNKAWSREPDGIRWEWYRITDDTPQ